MSRVDITRSIVASAMFFSFATAVSAEPERSRVPDGTEPESSTRLVCKTFSAPFGGRAGSRRICQSQYEWDLANREIRDAMDNVGNRSRAGNCNDPDFC